MFDIFFGSSHSAAETNRNFGQYRNERAFYEQSHSNIPELQKVPPSHSQKFEKKWQTFKYMSGEGPEQSVNNQKQIQEYDMLDSFFESAEGKLCPADSETVKALTEEEKANRKVLKGVVIHKLRQDYKRIGKRLDQLTKLASSDASVGTLGTVSTAGGQTESTKKASGSGDVFDSIFETFGMCQPKDASAIADRDLQKWQNYQREQAYRERQQRQVDEQRWVPSMDSPRNRAAETEVRAQPPVQAPAPKQGDLLDAVFDTLEFGLCAANTTSRQ